ncbi:MAG TPA: allantoicase [Amycolatopsis sp.]|nr:allantoicase [Amycolatopsis sp.]
MSTASEPTQDLAARLLGGTVMEASDEAFGDKENLLNPGPVDFVPGRYGPRGEIVDGWETRRRRTPGVDWALVRLGSPGVIRAVDVDTTSFTGNHPVGCRVEACGVAGYPSPAELGDADWVKLVPDTELAGDRSNLLPVDREERFTHVRLTIWPDGGVGRLRVWGTPVPDPRDYDIGAVDLASQRYGGLVESSSDSFYSSAQALNRPDEARSMGEGWETRRQRGDDPDWVVFRLAARAYVHAVVLDTAHFRYNASAECSLLGLDLDPVTGDTTAGASSWRELLPFTRLQPDTRHTFRLTATGHAVTHVRLVARPDGGLSRVRVIAGPDAAGRRALGTAWWNTLPAAQLSGILTASGVPAATADDLVRQRPRKPDSAPVDASVPGSEAVNTLLFGTVS